ncbi:glutamate--cysteine ligase [Vermiconidia calcicola]|uniref:Glutamate--cysteine ligase n=1 Tax=Vermiconidia calcicola TaxID=1690605 RepID=A0ACC3MNN7_9PEZI|nr:glutamate--cysteine ligase [Vermiconidia calcicola]
MAEPFSIAAGALQVAGGGFRLATTLYACAKDIRDAQKDINAIATEVRLTSGVLEGLATVLECDDVRQMYSATLRNEAKEAMQGCKDAFMELDQARKDILKTGADGTNQMSISAKMKWPLTKKKMGALQSNLHGLNVILSVMLGVLNLASRKVESTPNQPDPTADADQERLERLIKSNEDLCHKFTKGLSIGGGQERATDDNGSEHQVAGYLPGMILPGAQILSAAWANASNMNVTAIHESNEAAPGVPGPKDKAIMASFVNCKVSIEQLLFGLDEAMVAWSTWGTAGKRMKSMIGLKRCMDQLNDTMFLLPCYHCVQGRCQGLCRRVFGRVVAGHDGCMHARDPARTSSISLGFEYSPPSVQCDGHNPTLLGFNPVSSNDALDPPPDPIRKSVSLSMDLGLHDDSAQDDSYGAGDIEHGQQHKNFAESPAPVAKHHADGVETRDAFAKSDTKKRRGRAAPPRRCPNCHRTDSPEWRRGPDGARKICNACGLQYVKFTRKQTTTSETAEAGNSSLRQQVPQSVPEPESPSLSDLIEDFDWAADLSEVGDADPKGMCDNDAEEEKLQLRVSPPSPQVDHARKRSHLDTSEGTEEDGPMQKRARDDGDGGSQMTDVVTTLLERWTTLSAAAA